MTDFDSEMQDEIDAAWEWYQKQQQREAEDAYMAEICPCGHNHDHHYLHDGHCDVRHCDCPEFGEPLENWEIYTKVYLGDHGDDMGFIAYE